MAQDTLLRFLAHEQPCRADYVTPRLQRLGRTPPARQHLVRVTEPVVAHSPDFRFVRPFKGLELIERRGELIATDGSREIRTPYDQTVLVMPSPTRPRVGSTMVRLGRYEA